MKLHRLLSGLVAALFVFGPALLFVGGVRPEAFENRPLVEAPDPGDGWDALDDVGPWATDHLPGRADGVAAKAWIDYYVLGTLPPTQPNADQPALQGPDGPVIPAPKVLRGRDGYLFLGRDFDTACTNGPAFDKSLKDLGELADVIERSGRQVVFSVVPNKSSVVTDSLPRVLPHGFCSEQGLRHQEHVLDNFDHPLYFSVREELERRYQAGREDWWKTDTHWTTSGASVYAREIAARLDVTRPLTLQDIERPRIGDLMKLAGLSFEERAESQLLESGATVEPRTPGASGRGLPGADMWDSTPAEGLVPGRTVLLGDSFTVVSIDALRSLFAHGQFLSNGRGYTHDQMISQIVEADTVVLEVVQRNLAGSPLASEGFRKRLIRALNKASASRR